MTELFQQGEGPELPPTPPTDSEADQSVLATESQLPQQTEATTDLQEASPGLLTESRLTTNGIRSQASNIRKRAARELRHSDRHQEIFLTGTGQAIIKFSARGRRPSPNA